MVLRLLYGTPLCVALLCLSAANASALTFDFDQPAQFNRRWQVAASLAEPKWAVDEGKGALKVEGRHLTSVAVVRELHLRQASITVRCRIANHDPDCSAQIGVVFRVSAQTDAHARAGVPGQYVFVDPRDGELKWVALRNWLVEPSGLSSDYGAAVPLPELEPQEWFTLRVNFSAGGWHEAFLDAGAGDVLLIAKDRVLRSHVPEMELGLPEWTPVRELIEADDPLFQGGAVGIYAHRSGACADHLEVDSFQVSDWLAVPDQSSLATPWAQLKRQ